MSGQFKIGDRVTPRNDIYEPADEDSPGGYLARAGEALVVRRITPGGHWLYRVSHPEITNNSFGVTAEEIEAAK